MILWSLIMVKPSVLKTDTMIPTQQSIVPSGTKGAWLYRDYHRVHINGLYLGNKGDDTGVRWYKFKGSHSIKTISMMMRRTSNNN